VTGKKCRFRRLIMAGFPANHARLKPHTSTESYPLASHAHSMITIALSGPYSARCAVTI